MRPRTLLVLALLGGALLAGCSSGADEGREPLPPEWRGRDLREAGWANQTLQRGETLAMQYDWSAGKRVAWDWVVVAPIQRQDPLFTAFIHFQLVRLQGSDPATAQAIEAYDGQEGVGGRTIARAGTHQLDWMNEFDQPITVAYKAPSGGTRIVYPAGQGPDCLFGTRGADGCLAGPDLPLLPASAGTGRGARAASA